GGADLGSFLHHQAPRAGHRPGAGHRAGNRGRSRRAHRDADARRQGQYLPGGAAGMKKIRVLVADDENNLRDLIVRELSRRGLETEGVGDGEAALARMREDPYDVVVLDMKMPKKEGIEVLRELQDIP